MLPRLCLATASLSLSRLRVGCMTSVLSRAFLSSTIFVPQQRLCLSRARASDEWRQCFQLWVDLNWELSRQNQTTSHDHLRLFYAELGREQLWSRAARRARAKILGEVNVRP